MGEIVLLVILICMTTKLCKVENCGGNIHAKGLCKKHYYRLRIHGSTDLKEFSKNCTVEGCAGKSIAKGLCTTHYLRQRRHGSTDKPKFVREKLIEHGLSYCPKCNQTKPLDNFCKDKYTAFGVSIYCKICDREKGKLRYKNHKDKHINNRLRKKFGITLNEYHDLLKQQNGVCAICGNPPKENKPMLSVDHDHKTKKLRGILCSSCNQGIGLFHDNIEHLANAIKYLSIVRA